MRKAYDTFLQSEVSADLAAKSGGLELYRYECAHCGEEVRLAATGSMSMVAHFRHRNGNNDVDCEKYLGQYGSISIDPHSRKSRNERAEFYFDSSTKMFFLGLCFNENEISAYEDESAEFELRTTALEQAFYTLRINNINFMPDTPRMIPMERFSYNYFLSNTLNNVKRRYEFFKKDGAPTFFKIQGNDDNYKARLIQSTIIYTDVSYFAAFEGHYLFPQAKHIPSEISVSSTYHFETMGRKVVGCVLTVKKKTASVESLFSSWGYQIEASETLTLLWPPATQINEVSTINSDYAFLFSSFNLDPHGNINVHAADIKRVESSISKISINSRVRVYRKNAEIIIVKGEQHPTNYADLLLTESHAYIYTMPDNNICFLFDRSGATPIGKGQSVLITSGSLIKLYRSGYLEDIIYPIHQNELSGELLLYDILAYYKRTEHFTSEMFAQLELSDTAARYIEGCSESGVINAAAKRFIVEGQL